LLTVEVPELVVEELETLVEVVVLEVLVGVGSKIGMMPAPTTGDGTLS
jgi:hypothetical protein